MPWKAVVICRWATASSVLAASISSWRLVASASGGCDGKAPKRALMRGSILGSSAILLLATANGSPDNPVAVERHRLDPATDNGDQSTIAPPGAPGTEQHTRRRTKPPGGNRPCRRFASQSRTPAATIDLLQREAALRPFVLHLLEAATDLRRPEAAVPTEGADGGDLAGSRPTGHGLGIHPKQRSDLCRGQKRIRCGLVGHGSSLAGVRFVSNGTAWTIWGR